MKAKFSASESQKKGGSATANPFDDIVALEESEKKRVSKEIEAMGQSEQDLEKTLADKEADAEKALKDDAKVTLKEYKNSELSTILTAAKKEASDASEKVSTQFAKNKDATVTELVSKAIDTTFSLTT